MDPEHLIPLSGEGRSPWASLFLQPPHPYHLAHSLPVSPRLSRQLAVSQGHVQSEALWPIRQLHGRAPLLFPFLFLCVYVIFRVCVISESSIFELTPAQSWLHILALTKSSNFKLGCFHSPLVRALGGGNSPCVSGSSPMAPAVRWMF